MTSPTHTTRLAGIWAGVRLVVLDTETTTPPDDKLARVVAIAAVTCRNGRIAATWQTLVDPGCPIDAFSQTIHGLADSDVAGSPGFGDVLPEINRQFSGAEHERVVLVAHNASFDISVLRHEYGRAGADLADLPVLDTMGALTRIAGVHPPGNSLDAVATALGITNAKPHDALEDARTCALVAIELLKRAADQFDNIDSLLNAVSATRTTKVRAGARVRRGAPVSERTLPASHLATHTEVLAANVREKGLREWGEHVRECGELRCHLLRDRVRAARARPDRLLDELQRVLDQLTSEGDTVDTAAVATVLGAYLELVEHRPAVPGRDGLRRAQLAGAQQLSTQLGHLRRCEADDRCPDCTAGLPCPLDTWPEHVARHTLGEPNKNRVRGFFKLNGAHIGEGVWQTWERGGLDPRVTDAAITICFDWWRDNDHTVTADQLAQLAISAGRHHPHLTQARAAAIATSDPERAAQLCAETLRHRASSTLEAWDELETQHQRLLGLQQARDRATKNANPYIRPTSRSRQPHPSKFRPWDPATST